jgi:hypothetical protein
MSQPSEPTLRKRIDDYSYQVASDADPRFWFRLERKYDRDIITDYFLGSFPRERAAALLDDCYRVLGLSPRRTLVFRDILSTKGPAASGQALDDARDLYLEVGTALLTGSGARRVSDRLEFNISKYDLILVGE